MPKGDRSTTSPWDALLGASAFTDAPRAASIGAEHKKIGRARHCPVSGRDDRSGFPRTKPRVRRWLMLNWDSVFEWGRRASDKKAPAPATPVRDQLLESIIAHEQVEVLYQPQIEPSSGRILGAEALARSAITPS